MNPAIARYMMLFTKNYHVLRRVDEYSGILGNSGPIEHVADVLPRLWVIQHLSGLTEFYPIDAVLTRPFAEEVMGFRCNAVFFVGLATYETSHIFDMA